MRSLEVFISYIYKLLLLNSVMDDKVISERLGVDNSLKDVGFLMNFFCRETSNDCGASLVLNENRLMYVLARKFDNVYSTVELVHVPETFMREWRMENPICNSSSIQRCSWEEITSYLSLREDFFSSNVCNSVKLVDALKNNSDVFLLAKFSSNLSSYSEAMEYFEKHGVYSPWVRERIKTDLSNYLKSE